MRPLCRTKVDAPVEHRDWMTWAECLKRVFSIEFETCPVCGEAVRIIACIRDGGVVEKILTYLDAKSGAAEPSRRPLA